MKKRLLSILLTVCMVLTLLPTAALAASTAWNGTTDTSWYNGSQTSYTLYTAEQLAGLAVLVNGGNNFSGKTINLGADINLGGSINWTPIGTWDSSFSFKGNFDGKGFAVRNLKIDTGSAYSGLFGSVISGGTVKNLALIDSNIVCGSRSGTFIGLNFGTIQNCYSNGYITAGVDHTEAIGGIVGSNDSGGIIENCYFSGARVSSWATSGQITGYCYTPANVRNCYFNVYVNGSLGTYVTTGQMQGFPYATNDGWEQITVSSYTGKISLVDALNKWVNANGSGYNSWYCTSADGDVYPGFVKEEFIVSISDGTGVGTNRTTAATSKGAITSGTTYVEPRETVTLTLGEPTSAYRAGTVSVYKTGNSATTIGVTLISAGVYQFTMPRYPVTIATSYAPKSDLNNITAFSFTNPAVSGMMSSSDHTVTVIVPNGTNVSSLSPSITVSPYATINPISGAAQNFTSDVTYTVTAENGSTQSWTITVLIQTATPSDIGFDAVTSMLTGISDGMEYSVDGGSTWVTITGSVSGKAAISGVTTAKGIQVRNNGAAPHTAPSLASTINITQAATPSAPTISAVTANSVTLASVNGNEYSKNGSTWQESNLFDNLNPATGYTFYQRVAASGATLASIKSDGQAQYTAAAKPAAGIGYSINYTTEKITVNSGYEVNTDEGFGAGTAVPNNETLISGNTYYVRMAANGAVPASEAVSFTIPARPAAPTVITADKTKNSITVTTVAGQEYKLNTGAWQNSGSFTGLSAGTDYTIYARVKAVSTGSVSFASEEYSTTIKTKTDGSVGFSLPTISLSPTYTPSKTLNDISLPTDWAWSTPSTVPTVTNSGYSAVYTPTDANTVDYSGVAGYAIDGSGKVTITRTISLTVNRAAPTAADFTYTAPTSLAYSGIAKTAAVAVNGGISGMGAVTVKYYLDGVETTPTNSGTYTVKVDIAQGGNYSAATAISGGAWTFTITKEAQTYLSITGTPASVTYGDTFTLSTTGGSGTGAVTWAVTSGSSATVNENSGAVTITGVGKTTITATKAADGNYTDAVTDTYTFTPSQRLITLQDPTAKGGWIKTYDGKTDFDKSIITVGGITNKVGSDAVTVTVQSAVYDTEDVGSGKTLTITYAIDGADSQNYSAPDHTVISAASITAAAPTITLKSKTEIYTDKKIEIDAASVKGVTGGTTPDGAITYTYYTKDTCTEADKTTVDKSGAEAVGGAPKNACTYYVKATIAASGNYTAATSAAVTLTIYYPSSGEDKSSSPVIVDGKTVDMGTSEMKDGATIVTVDQRKMTEQLKTAKDSVVIPVTSKTEIASAQLVVQNVERMAERGVSLTIIAGDVSYSIPAGAMDTAATMEALGASDSSKVTLNVSISQLSNSSVIITGGTLMVAPVEFTITATYNGNSVEVEKFGSYVQRVIEITDDTDPKTITTAVVVEADGTQRHVPTEVYSENGKWYARINAMTNSTYALIQNSVSFTDTKGKWYDASVTEMASRKIINGIGETMFAGERAITRAEFAAIIVRALGLPTTGTSAFTDVVSNAWYYGAVGTAFEYGIVCGKGDGIFDPSANITREEAMVMVARAAKLCGMDTTIASSATGLSSFEDASQISSWAHDSASFNVSSGLIKGSNGKINPKANITRAETATVVLRLLQKAGLVDIRTVA